MDSKFTLLPHDIVEAVENAKSKEDPNGYSAFRFNLERVRTDATYGNSYFNFEINALFEGKRKFVPIKIKFINVMVVGKIAPPDDISRDQNKKITVKISNDAKFTKDKKEEDYGKALLLVHEAFKHHINLYMKSDPEIKPGSTNISSFIQEKRKEMIGKKQSYVPLDKPIIRMEIEFKKPKAEKEPKTKTKFEPDDNTEFKIKIYDITKPIDKKDPRYKPGVFNYEELMYEDKNQNTKHSLTYGNIYKVIGHGSKISGVNNLSTICLSKLGNSLKSTAEFLIVNATNGASVDPTEIFDSDELNIIEDKKEEIVDEFTEN